mgnify:CR=1 FL=1
MKTRVLIVLLAALAMQTVTVFAQSQKAEVISGGGGTSTNGQYSNFGVVGEPIANPLPTNANYQNRQGFIHKLGPSTCPITVYPAEYWYNSAGLAAQMALITIGGVEGGDCYWQATSDSWWIVIKSDPYGMGTGTLTYDVLANSTGVARTGRITVTTGDADPTKSPKEIIIHQTNSLAVPTLPEWGMIILSAGLLIGSGFYLRRIGLI